MQKWLDIQRPPENQKYLSGKSLQHKGRWQLHKFPHHLQASVQYFPVAGGGSF